MSRFRVYGSPTPLVESVLEVNNNINALTYDPKLDFDQIFTCIRFQYCIFCKYPALYPYIAHV